MTTDRSQPFDPTQYLVKLKRRQKTAEGGWQTVELDYLEVRNRLVWLRHEHPEAQIVTRIHTLDDHLCVVQAEVSIPGGGTATGTGSETPDDWKDYIEKAETKAVGRALAALGFGTAFCQDFDFGEGDPEKVVDAPAQRPKAVAVSPVGSAPPSRTPSPSSSPRPSGSSSAPQNGGAPAGGWQDQPLTEPQRKALYAVGRGVRQMEEAELEAWCETHYGARPSGMTRRQASSAIDALKLGTSS